MSPDAAPTPEVLLPLDTPRTLTLRFGKHNLSYKFRRIAGKDWKTCFSGQFHETRQTASGIQKIFERESAAIALVDATVQSVEGYGGDLAALKNWKASLPAGHRLAFGTTLAEVAPEAAAADEGFTLSDLVAVKLRAFWSVGSDGKMTMFGGLAHNFRQPSIEQLQKFQRQTSRVFVTQGGTTRYPSRAAIAMEMYDDLIESVAGYSVGGIEISSREDAIREMDGSHKAEALLNVFASPQEAVAETEEEQAVA